jgi:hypothetical protein
MSLRGRKFKLSFLADECTVTAVRLGTLYFRSGEDRYQMPMETFNKHVATQAEPPRWTCWKHPGQKWTLADHGACGHRPNEGKNK